ncbi:MAG: WYL domain-containing protein [Saprospiraceae bacterium]|nr:WYL domain-containing protein [Saprospiraceae bacterium]
MANEKEYTGRQRALRILFSIVESPYFYTIKRLAEKYEVDESSIKRDFEAFKTAGFDIDYDERFRYALSAEKKYENLKSVLIFSKKEEDTLNEALRLLGADNRDVEKLRIKMGRIYDVSKMHSTFDKNFLTKMDKLEKAKLEKKTVILKDYHSTSSSSVKNRHIEVFHISAEEDIVHAYDLDANDIRHFRISRIPKLEITPTPWTNIKRHNIVATDPFRIQDDKQLKVHLQLKVGAYNELLERFPLTRTFLKEVSTDNDDDGVLYDLECRVNHRFYGLTNFILGYHHNIVAILEPDSLVDHIRNEAQKLLEQKF